MKVLYAGSFDPIHYGHIEILRKAAKLFDHVILLIANNPEKTYLFSAQERMHMCNMLLMEEGLCNIIVEFSANEFTVNAAKRLGANALIRGIRNEGDYIEEKKLSDINKRICPDLDTVFLLSTPETSSISSSALRLIPNIRFWTRPAEAMTSPGIVNQISKKRVESIMRKMVGEDTLATVGFTYDHKPYHNWTHVAWLLDLLADHADHSSPFLFYPEMQVAILLHDHVNPETVTEAEVSNLMQYYGKTVQSYVHAVEVVHGYIKITNHDITAENMGFDTMFLHDADLDVLSWDNLSYRSYAQKIRKEYQIPHFKWVEGRIKFLKMMLSRKQIYYSKEFQDKELRAKCNLQRELTELETLPIKRDTMTQ